LIFSCVEWRSRLAGAACFTWAQFPSCRPVRQLPAHLLSPHNDNLKIGTPGGRFYFFASLAFPGNFLLYF
jgi:hypothetical protein